MRTPPVARGQRLTVKPDSLVAGGDAICRIEGFPLFVSGIYPGDTAVVEIVELKKGFARGTMVELTEPSADRKPDPCPLSRRCGGCDWPELRLEAQLEAKKGILLDSLRRVGKLDPATLPPVTTHASPLNYRLRSRLHADAEDPSRIGFFAPSSHDVVPLSERCEVVGTGLLENLASLGEIAVAGEAIEAFETDDDFVAHAREADESDGVPVELRVGDFSYSLSTTSFFQVNKHLLPRLVELVSGLARASAGHGLALDLYGGVGFFALPLAEIFASVITVEGDGASHRFATMNAGARTNVECVSSSVERFLAQFDRHPDFVLVDPPRAGMTPEVRDALVRLGAKTICYLSCDPVTFSRDAAELVRHGWSLHTLDLLDLFPNTHHVETLSSLEIEQ